ncbi:MAG: serine/threonine protein kinase, partial [Myxococcaceae bacterium]|nr:serine/threonine protein kinase [Myxococcaceae bacterium]
MKRPIPFGNYLLVDRISVGGMAEIFLAKRVGAEGDERRVAIKRILPAMAEDPDFTRMFLDEARICVQLNHPNIVRFSDLGMHDGTCFIAMEYVAGKDLRSLMEHQASVGQPMPVAQAIFIASRLLSGLDYAHRSTGVDGRPLGIIHRDVSPQNVLISYAGDIKLIDFGIAKAATNSQRTQAGFLKGKIGYMSPEQIVGSVDRRADLFAVGIILFELLTGQRLFTGPTDFAVLAKIRSAEVPSLCELNPAIPPELEAIVLRALKADPDERYQWCSDLEADLRPFLTTEAGEPFTAKALSASLQETFHEDFARDEERAKRLSEAVVPVHDARADDDDDDEEDEDMAHHDDATGESPAPDYEDDEMDEASLSDESLEDDEDDEFSEGATVAIMGVPFFDDDDEEEEAASAPQAQPKASEAAIGEGETPFD